MAAKAQPRSKCLLQRRGSGPFPEIPEHTQKGPGKETRGQPHLSLATDYFPEGGGQAIPEGEWGMTRPLNTSAPRAQRPTQKPLSLCLGRFTRARLSSRSCVYKPWPHMNFLLPEEVKTAMTGHHHRQGEETHTY